MVTLAKSGNAIVFTFDDNDHYLNDGTIAVPVNSLTLVTDESQMATFKKSATNDIFISATYNELGMSKADLESWFKENACGSTGGGSGSGVTSGEVQTMIDDALVPYAESSAVTEEITEAVSGKADTSAVTEAVSGKMDTSAFTEYSASTDARLAEDEEVTAAGLNELNDALSGKADTSAVTASITAAVSGKADSNSVYTKAEIDSALSGKQDTLIAGTNITISGNVISAAGGGGGNNVIELTQAEYDALTDIDPDAFYIITDAAGAVTTGQVQTMIDDSISGKADTSAVTASITAAVSGKQDTLVSGTNIKTINNESILGSGNINIQGGGGLPESAFTAYSAATDARLAEDEEVTAAALNALDEKKADVSAVTESLSGKQDTLVAGSGITISGNVISSEGGGATYSAGRGIAIDTGNTISLNVGVGELTGASVDNINNIAIGGYAYGKASNKNTNTVSGSKTSGNFAIGGYNSFQGQDFGGLLSNSTIIGTNNIIEKTSSTSSSFYGGAIIGENNKLSAPSLNGTSILIGKANSGSSSSQYAFGFCNKLINYEEFTLGKFNNSVSGSTDADKTFFSIGNGTADNARHNALEIRKNGDIYCNNGTADIKLQDYLQIKVMAISQADYDALVQGGTVDANTLYVITGSN